MATCCKRIVALRLKCQSCGREIDYICDARYWEGSLPDESKSYAHRICVCKDKVEVSLELALKHIFIKEGCIL